MTRVRYSLKSCEYFDGKYFTSKFIMVTLHLSIHVHIFFITIRKRTARVRASQLEQR